MSEESYEFYRDPTTEGCVIAVSQEAEGRRSDGMVEGFAGTFDQPNSSVSWTAIDPAILGDPISEEKARDIHPRLFEHLDQVNQ